MSTDAPRVKEPPSRGPWAWRERLPCCDDELNDLRARAAAANPPGIHLGRWLRWVEAEANGEHAGIRGNSVLAKYRLFLYRLQADHEAVCDCADLVGVAEGAQNPRFSRVLSSSDVAAAS
jgi:hypothetical protein